MTFFSFSFSVISDQRIIWLYNADTIDNTSTEVNVIFPVVHTQAVRLDH